MTYQYLAGNGTGDCQLLPSKWEQAMHARHFTLAVILTIVWSCGAVFGQAEFLTVEQDGTVLCTPIRNAKELARAERTVSSWNPRGTALRVMDRYESAG